MRSPLLLATLLLASACSTGGGGSRPDLAGRDLTFNFDLAGPDFSEPPDLSESRDLTCAGTMAANSCAAFFFAPIDGCFSSVGQCTRETDGMTYSNGCWPNGNKVLVSNIDNQNLTGHVEWWGSNGLCLSADIQGNMNGTVFHLHLDGKTLDYDNGSGDVTCPDGSMTNIGGMGSDCPAIQVYLNPPFSNCMMGACK